ncbi:MAG: glycosyltransferase [Clostridiales bacterium]|nr:glycosyltransferase [Clostridiales bacterium]
MEHPCISVLMGIYNCSATLETAVDCIINQTFEDWELIMCDDCSTDDTYKLACKLAQKDNRIKVIKNEVNRTLAPTLNHCLKYAKGKYCARMDGDDVCIPERFQKEVDFLESNSDFALVSASMDHFDENGKYGKSVFPENPTPTDFVSHTPFCHACCMIRTDILKKVNGYSENKDVERIEDYDLWLRLYEAGYKGYNFQESMYSMRDDRNAIKRQKFKYRLTEYKLRLRIVKVFNLSFVYNIKALRPIILGLIPTPIYVILHKVRLRK